MKYRFKLLITGCAFAFLPFLLTGCLEESLQGNILSNPSSIDEQTDIVEDKTEWEKLRVKLREESIGRVEHIYQAVLLGEEQDTLLLGTKNGIWKIDLSDVSLGEQILGEELIVEGKQIRVQPQISLDSTLPTTGWSVQALSGFQDPYTGMPLVFASGRPSSDAEAQGSPYNFGLFFSKDTGETWEEVGGLSGKVGFNVLAAGGVKLKQDGELTNNSQWGIIGVDETTGELLTNIVDIDKGEVTGEWLIGPKGSYASVAVVDGFFLALDPEAELLRVSEDSGLTWTEISVPGCMYIFTVWQIPGVRGEIFIVMKNGDLMYLPKTMDEGEGSEPLLDRLVPAGRFPALIVEGATVGVSGSRYRIATAVGDRVYLSGDWGYTFTQVAFSLKD